MIERDESFYVHVVLEDGAKMLLPTVSGPFIEAATRAALMLLSKELERRGIDQNTVVSFTVSAALCGEP